MNATTFATRSPSANAFKAGPLVTALLGGLYQAAHAAPKTLTVSRAPRVLTPQTGQKSFYRDELARWVVLCGLESAAPIAAGDAILLSLLSCVEVDVQLARLSNALEFLSVRGLVTVEVEAGRRVSKLTEAGMAVVSYAARAPAGIARPSLF